MDALMCPNLKEFSIILLSSFLPLEGLPETLEHLSFRNYIWAPTESLKPVIQAIDSLPKLKVITCDTNGPDHPEWSVLVEKCARKGVVLSPNAIPIYAVSFRPVPALLGRTDRYD